jgi:aryl-alcohol dehydrogenase-like predicted oxidoreductase
VFLSVGKLEAPASPGAFFCPLCIGRHRTKAGKAPAIRKNVAWPPLAARAAQPRPTYETCSADVARARRLMPLVEEGFAASLTEAATRFALSHPAMGVILVGMATPQQFEDALAAVQKGPLPPAALGRLSVLQQAFAGEPR